MNKKNMANERIGLEKHNKFGDLMKIILYNNAHDIVVEFQDLYKAQVHTEWKHFNKGEVKNPYSPSVFGVGITGNKYPACYYDDNGKKKNTKEYQTWMCVLQRSFYSKEKERHSTYKNVTCCEEWLLFENFYEWLHSQENFETWYKLDFSAIDKDILVKGNKIYSPETCCLVPASVNGIFVKCDALRGNLPVGVVSRGNKYRAQLLKWGNYITFTSKNTYQEAFKDYKYAKEEWIKQVAQEEYKKGTITEKCYNAMMNYEVEITD